MFCLSKVHAEFKAERYYNNEMLCILVKVEFYSHYDIESFLQIKVYAHKTCTSSPNKYHTHTHCTIAEPTKETLQFLAFSSSHPPCFLGFIPIPILARVIQCITGITKLIRRC